METSTLNLLIGGAIGVIGTLCGSIISGYFNRANLKLQLQKSQEFDIYKQHKKDLEELHNLVGNYSDTIAIFWRSLSLIDRDVKTPKKERVTQLANELGVPLSAIHTKIKIHAPECLITYYKLNTKASELIELGVYYLQYKVESEAVITKRNEARSECEELQGKIESLISDMQPHGLIKK